MGMTDTYRRTPLSQAFFKTVFTDAFLFRDRPFEVLEASGLSEAEKLFAIGIYNVSYYGPRTWAVCNDMVGKLGHIYRWQGNSEGPAVFCSYILYLLKVKKQTLPWFIAQLQGREDEERAPEDTWPDDGAEERLAEVMRSLYKDGLGDAAV